jgi:cytosine/adenosine deaminase-related metal-dependent hydrolase
LDDLGFLDERTLAVHLVQATEKGITLLKERMVKPVLCPSSNLHLLGRLPMIKEMLLQGLKPSLGTDSPASGASLNLFHEMELLLDAGIKESAVFEMATRNGAEALDLSHDFGRLEEGASPYLITVSLSREESSPLKDVIRQGARGLIRWAVFPNSENRMP